MKKTLKIIILGSLFTTNLVSAPVKGMFASVKFGGKGIYQDHKYVSPSGSTGKFDNLKIGSFLGLGFGILNQVEKSKAVLGGEVEANLNQAGKKYILDVGNGAEGNLAITNPYSFGAYGIAGVMMTPHVMVYTKAGYAWMRTNLKYTNLQNENPNSQTFKKTMSGVSGGGGASYLLTDKIIIGAEYLYSRPTPITPRKNDTVEGGQKRTFEYSPTVHSLGLKISYLF